jgi:hypothetical protein
MITIGNERLMNTKMDNSQILLIVLLKPREPDSEIDQIIPHAILHLISKFTFWIFHTIPIYNGKNRNRWGELSQYRWFHPESSDDLILLSFW